MSHNNMKSFKTKHIRKKINSFVIGAIAAVLSLLWASVILWAIAASFRPPNSPIGAGNIWFGGSFSLANYIRAWHMAPFLLYYRNTLIVVFLILVVQVITAVFAGFAFANYEFVGKRWLLFFILLQLMIPTTALLVPNFATIRELGLYDTLLAIALPYFGSAFGTFLMRQAFLEVPYELVEAGIIDGCNWWQLIRHVYLPPAIPTLLAFVISSVTWHWNEFLWPLVVTSSNKARVLTVGLVRFTQLGEIGAQWPLLAAATLIVVAPLLIAFIVFQKRFINSFLYSGIK